MNQDDTARCEHCGYDVGGLPPVGECPQCNAPYDMRGFEGRTDDPHRPRVPLSTPIGFVLLLILFTIVDFAFPVSLAFGPILGVGGSLILLIITPFALRRASSMAGWIIGAIAGWLAFAVFIAASTDASADPLDGLVLLYGIQISWIAVVVGGLAGVAAARLAPCVAGRIRR